MPAGGDDMMSAALPGERRRSAGLACRHRVAASTPRGDHLRAPESESRLVFIAGAFEAAGASTVSDARRAWLASADQSASHVDHAHRGRDTRTSRFTQSVSASEKNRRFHPRLSGSSMGCIWGRLNAASRVMPQVLAILPTVSRYASILRYGPRPPASASTPRTPDPCPQAAVDVTSSGSSCGPADNAARVRDAHRIKPRAALRVASEEHRRNPRATCPIQSASGWSPKPFSKPGLTSSSVGNFPVTERREMPGAGQGNEVELTLGGRGSSIRALGTSVGYEPDSIGSPAERTSASHCCGSFATPCDDERSSAAFRSTSHDTVRRATMSPLAGQPRSLQWLDDAVEHHLLRRSRIAGAGWPTWPAILLVLAGCAAKETRRAQTISVSAAPVVSRAVPYEIEATGTAERSRPSKCSPRCRARSSTSASTKAPRCAPARCCSDRRPALSLGARSTPPCSRATARRPAGHARRRPGAHAARSERDLGRRVRGQAIGRRGALATVRGDSAAAAQAGSIWRARPSARRSTAVRVVSASTWAISSRPATPAVRWS